MKTLIDAEGFRANVAMVILNSRGQVFWGRRCHQSAWQFPQGGVNPGESALQAMYRELQEEVGLLPQDVEVILATDRWLKYRLPKKFIRRQEPVCIGQKQKWFLLRLRSPDEAINLTATDSPEFDGWKWVHYWRPAREVVGFKRRVYKQALRYFYSTARQTRMMRKKVNKGAVKGA